jgi:hypothetical protein
MASENNNTSLYRLFLRLRYFWEYLREYHRYPYILEGEVHNSDFKQTILMYRRRGKRDIFELPAQDICNNPDLISKFHPLDVRIVAYISAVEQILEIEPEHRFERFTIIKDKIFSNSR